MVFRSASSGSEGLNRANSDRSGGSGGGPVPWLEVDAILVDETNFDTMQVALIYFALLLLIYLLDLLLSHILLMCYQWKILTYRLPEPILEPNLTPKIQHHHC